jgi:hypothetical protein
LFLFCSRYEFLEESSLAANFTDDLFVMIQDAHTTVWNVVLFYFVDNKLFCLRMTQCVKRDGNLVFMQNSLCGRSYPSSIGPFNPNPPIEVRMPLSLHIPTGLNGSTMDGVTSWLATQCIIKSASFSFRCSLREKRHLITTYVLHPLITTQAKACPAQSDSASFLVCFYASDAFQRQFHKHFDLLISGLPISDLQRHLKSCFKGKC